MVVRSRRSDRSRPVERTAPILALVVMALASGPLLFELPTGFPSTHPALFAPSAVTNSPAPWPTPIRHVIVLFLENTERSDVLANGSFERYLAGHYASASHYYSIMHYSLPNYLAATSGLATNLFSTVGQRNLGDTLQKAGRSWGAFMESMPTPCDLTATNDYSFYHNPFLVYKDVVNNTERCDAHDVNLTVFANDVASNRVPNYAFIAPNLTDDAHNTNVSVADQWLRSFLTPLVNDSFFRSTAIFVTYDEGSSSLGLGANGTGGGNVYLTVVSPFARTSFTSTRPYSHYDLLTTTEWLLGLGRTGTNDNWTAEPPMTDLFDFQPTYPVTGQVHRHSGARLPGALVSDGNGTAVVANATGCFALRYPNGTYTLTANDTGYYNQSITITVNGSSVRQVTFRLTPVP